MKLSPNLDRALAYLDRHGFPMKAKTHGIFGAIFTRPRALCSMITLGPYELIDTVTIEIPMMIGT